MTGNSLVVDTNILIYQLGGDKTIEGVLEGKNVFLSFISKIELLSFQKHKQKEEDVPEQILDYSTIVHSNDSIVELTVQFRKKYHLKTPDAIILVTAAYLNLPFFTADQDLFKVKGVEIIEYMLE